MNALVGMGLASGKLVGSTGGGYRWNYQITANTIDRYAIALLKRLIYTRFICSIVE